MLSISYQEISKNMIDRLPEDKLIFIINILENIGEMSGVNFYPEFTPIRKHRQPLWKLTI